MNILFCKWNGCAEQAMEQAFCKMGHQVDSVTYAFPSADYSTECLTLLQTAMTAKQYQVVFSQNFIPIVSKVCQIYKLIYVSWVMDSPAHHLYSKAVENACNRIFIFDRSLYEKTVVRNPKGVFYQPLATCVDTWDIVLAGKAPARGFKADVSFLGSLYINECNYDTVEQVPEFVKGYLDGLIEAQYNVYGYNLFQDALSDEVVDVYAKCADWMQRPDYIRDDKTVVAEEYLSKKCSQLERVRISEMLSKSAYDYKLYTNSPVPNILRECAKGVVGYYDEMPWVFHNSKINLNITAKGIQSGIPLRMFDIMGAGGFVLTNYQPELAEYFVIGEEVAVYESVPHLLEQVDYYLHHEEERIEIAQKGYEKVKAMFTYDIALKEMLNCVFGL